MSRRTERVNELIREELGDILVREVADPRISGGVVSITEVKVSADLHFATVYFSTLGGAARQREAQESLEQAAPFIHRSLRTRLRTMRRVPDLRFRFDPSLERGAYLSALIRETNAPDEQ